MTTTQYYKRTTRYHELCSRAQDTLDGWVFDLSHDLNDDEAEHAAIAVASQHRVRTEP